MKLNRGFTLIEAVIVIALTAIIAMFAAGFIFASMRAYVLIAARESAVDSARTAMNRMTMEMRRIRKPQNILISTNSECQFINLEGDTIDFQQSGTNLLRNSDVLAASLASPEGLRFTYLDTDGNVTAVKKDMRSIRIRLVISTSTQAATLESSARIRNL